MAVNLVKGQRINLGLSHVKVGLGWDSNNSDTGFDFDLDASAFCLDSNGKCASEKHFVFYGNKFSPDGAVQGADDDRTGDASEGDDETIKVNLDKVASDIQEILFVATIYEHEERKQNFGQVRNSYIRILNDANDEVMAIYELDEDFSIETAVEFGRLYRKNGEWKFEALGKGYNHGLDFLVEKYGLSVG